MVGARGPVTERGRQTQAWALRARAGEPGAAEGLIRSLEGLTRDAIKEIHARHRLRVEDWDDLESELAARAIELLAEWEPARGAYTTLYARAARNHADDWAYRNRGVVSVPPSSIRAKTRQGEGLVARRAAAAVATRAIGTGSTTAHRELADLPAGSDDGEAARERFDRRMAWVRSRLGALTQYQAEVVHLRYFAAGAAEPWQETAWRVGTSRRNAQARHDMAIQRLRELAEAEGGAA